MIIDAQFTPSGDAHIASAIFTLTSFDIPDDQLSPAGNTQYTSISFTVKPGEEVRIEGQKCDFPLIRNEGLGGVPIIFSMTIDQLYKVLYDAGSPTVIFKSIKIDGKEEALIDYIMAQIGTDDIYIPSIDGFNALALVNNGYLTNLNLTLDQIYIDIIVASMVGGTEETTEKAMNVILVTDTDTSLILEKLQPEDIKDMIQMEYSVENAGYLMKMSSVPIVSLPNYVPMNVIRTKIVTTGTVATIGASLVLRSLLSRRK